MANSLLWYNIPLEISAEDNTALLQAWQPIAKLLESAQAPRAADWAAFDTVLTQVAKKLRPLTQALERRRNGGKHIALRLFHTDPRLLNLPWMRAKLGPADEALHDLERLYLTVCPKRFIEADNPRVPALPGPMKILIMVSNPVNLEAKDRLNFEEEEFQLLQAFLPLLEQGRVEIDFTENGSLDALKRKLEENPYHILHFSGHGTFRDETGYLLLEDDLNLRSKPVSATEFAEALVSLPDQPVPLVHLSACLTATGVEVQKSNPDQADQSGQFQDRELEGTTMELLRKGIPAVIAMNASIRDYHARYFSEYFYRELAKPLKTLKTLPQAFREARLQLRRLEYQLQEKGFGPPVQWLIPRLYLSKNLEQPVAWEVQKAPLSYPHLKKAFRIDPSIIRPEGDQYLFIGRRQLLGSIMEPFFKKEPVLLKGQGGVGKSALAEHLVNRLRLRVPGLHTFVTTEKSKTTLPEILGSLKTVAEEMLSVDAFDQLEAKLDNDDTPIKKFRRLLEAISKHCQPLFLFDNLETFLAPDHKAFQEQHQDLRELIAWLVQHPEKAWLLCTSRHPLPGLPITIIRDLNQVSFNDFLKKCTRLSLSLWQQELQEKLHTQTKKEAAPKATTFTDLVKILYTAFGGNFYYVELFDKVWQASRAKFIQAIRELEGFQSLVEATKPDLLQEMSEKLFFQTLLDLCETQELETLRLLSQFPLPVQPEALIQQGHKPDPLPHILQKLVTLTLVEASEHWAGQDKLNLYYVTPLIRDLLHKTDRPPTAPFNPTLAGNYYFHHYTNLDGDLTHLEAAHNYFLASKSEAGLQQTGGRLTYIYRALHDYRQAYRFGLQTYEILGDKSEFYLLNWLGLTAHTLGKLALALECYEKAQKLAEADQNKKQLGTTFNNISQIYDARGEYDKALTFLNKALLNRKEIGDKSGEGTTLNNLATIAHARGEYDKALTFLNKALNIFQETGDKKQEGATLNNISQIYDARGEYDKALTFLNKVLKITQEIGDKSGEGTTLNNISQIHRARGEYDKALTFLNKALNIQQEIGDKSGEGATLHNISIIYHARGEYDKALTFLNKALNIFQETGDKKQEGTTLNNISLIYDARGEYDKALTFLNKALLIRKEIGDKSGEGTTLNNISQIYHVRGEYDMALTFLNKALNIRREIGDKSGEGTTLNNLATIAHARGEYDMALTFLNKALNIRTEIGDLSGQANTLHNIASIYLENKNDPEKFIQLESEAFQIAVQIGNTNAIYQIGKYWGTILFQNGATEPAHEVLTLTLQAGEQGQYPDLPQFKAHLKKIGYLK